MNNPPSILANRAQVARWLDDGDGLLLGLDFDGTLAPIVSDPDDARINGRAKSLVGTLSDHPQVTVAIISGRSLDDLLDRVSIDGPLYAGNHGLELTDGHTRRTHPIAQARIEAIAEITEELRTRLAGDPGVMVEHKGLTATVHFRQAVRPGRVASTVETVVAQSDADVEVTNGRAIREIRPALEWGKDSAMQLFQSLVPDGHRPMYIGDDITDEEAFDAIEDEGVAVRVGAETGPGTAATHQVPNQEQVPDVLDWLAEYAYDRWDTPDPDDTTTQTDDGTTEMDDSTTQILEGWEGMWHPAALKH